MIQGDPTLCTQQASWKAMVKGWDFMYKIWDSQLQKIQPRATRVFHLPMELPPKRAHDHAIVLKPRAAIPNLRPYKYPYYQNNEIEKIVKEMLHTGIVRHSASLFSSPVLLVKNKRWGWRFCSLH
jgi:hypothetical protein